MAKHYREIHDSDPSSLKVQGIEVIKKTVRGGWGQIEKVAAERNILDLEL